MTQLLLVACSCALSCLFISIFESIYAMMAINLNFLCLIKNEIRRKLFIHALHVEAHFSWILLSAQLLNDLTCFQK